MPGRKAGRSSSKPFKAKASKPVKVKASKPVKVKAPKPVKVKPEKVKPVKVKPVNVKPGRIAPTPRFVASPLPPPKSPPRLPLKTALKPPSKTPLTLPQRIEIAPRKSPSSSWLKAPPPSFSQKSSSNSPFLSNPSSPYPPDPNRFPGPSSTSKLKSSKSVPDFAGSMLYQGGEPSLILLQLVENRAVFSNRPRAVRLLRSRTRVFLSLIDRQFPPRYPNRNQVRSWGRTLAAFSRHHHPRSNRPSPLWYVLPVYGSITARVLTTSICRGERKRR